MKTTTEINLRSPADKTDWDCFAVPGRDSIIDVVRPGTDRTWVLGCTLEQTRQKYPGAERMKLDEFCRQKTARDELAQPQSDNKLSLNRTPVEENG
jgi:hypothetical protein